MDRQLPAKQQLTIRKRYHSCCYQAPVLLLTLLQNNVRILGVFNCGDVFRLCLLRNSFEHRSEFSHN